MTNQESGLRSSVCVFNAVCLLLVAFAINPGKAGAQTIGNNKPPQGGALPSIAIRDAPPIKFPGGNNPNRQSDFLADSNSPSHWSGSTLYVFNSWEQPWRATGPDAFHLGKGSPVGFENPELKKMWIWVESTWKDDDGMLYGWVHNEVPNICPPKPDNIPGYPIVVRVGAVRSTDDGANWKYLGSVLGGAADSVRCNTQNPWYAGGMGDQFVMPDKEKKYFYFFFTNYSGIFAEQGICMARMHYSDRDNPRGKVWLYYKGMWNEPGIGGNATPLFPATVDIARRDCNTFWGPSIHWNTYLDEYVMLLNRVYDSAWQAEGIYISFNPDLSDPNGWSPPQKIMDRQEAIHADPQKPGNGWYAQVMGTGRGETDKLAGRTARIFLDGQSRWEIEFQRPGEK